MLPVDGAVLAAFIATTLALVLSPGPDTVLILRYTLGSGARTGLAAVLGVQIGLGVHTALAAVGLTLVIAAAPLALKTIAVAGAAYLGWLGLQALRAGRLSLGAADGPATVGVAKAARDALFTNLLNPKVVLLFLALMPQFVVLGRAPVPAQLAFLGVVLILVNTVWQSGLVALAGGMRRWLDRPGVQRVLSLFTGGVFLAFAALMLWEHLR